MGYYVYIDKILGLQTSLKTFSWIYGRVAPKATEEDYEACKIKVNIEVRPSKEIMPDDLDEYNQYSHYYAKKNEKKIYYNRTLCGHLKLTYSIGIKGNNVEVKVNKNYMKFIKYKFMNLYDMSYILSDFISGLLLLNGYATLHCSAISNNECGTVIFGPPNIGKTLTAIKLCEMKKIKYIAEDMAITDGINIYSVPWTTSFRVYNCKQESLFDKLLGKGIKSIPVLDLVSFKKEESICKYINSEKLRSKAPITDVILLSRGEDGAHEIGEEIKGYLINLNKYELNYHKAPSMLVMQYFNMEISLDEMYHKEQVIIEKMLAGSRKWQVSSKSALRYKEIIEEVLKNE